MSRTRPFHHVADLPYPCPLCGKPAQIVAALCENDGLALYYGKGKKGCCHGTPMGQWTPEAADRPHLWTDVATEGRDDFPKIDLSVLERTRRAHEGEDVLPHHIRKHRMTVASGAHVSHGDTVVLRNGTIAGPVRLHMFEGSVHWRLKDLSHRYHDDGHVFRCRTPHKHDIVNLKPSDGRLPPKKDPG